jgi:hypothetical protein
MLGVQAGDEAVALNGGNEMNARRAMGLFNTATVINTPNWFVGWDATMPRDAGRGKFLQPSRSCSREKLSAASFRTQPPQAKALCPLLPIFDSLSEFFLNRCYDESLKLAMDARACISSQMRTPRRTLAAHSSGGY